MLSPFKTRALLKVAPETDLANARNERADSGTTFEMHNTTSAYEISHTVRGGIERVHYLPNHRNSHPPILMIHGMWHAAFCWDGWQKDLAKRGWESTSFSLPGHGRSPAQRPVAECSLAYYLRFVADEVARVETPPILFGHSMGGALVQWYLKYIGPLPATVFVASWTSHDILKDCMWNAMKVDPAGSFLSPFLGWRFQFRNAKAVQKWFLSKGATDAAQALKPQLGPESEIVLMQHRPAYWDPPKTDKSPKLWICAGKDAIIPTNASHKSALHYAADLMDVPDCGHDIMLDPTATGTIEKIENWLCSKF